MAYQEGPQYIAANGKRRTFNEEAKSEPGFNPGDTYMFCARGGMAICRWGDTPATTFDNGFDFSVPEGGIVFSRCPPGATSLSVIEADNTSAATAALFISRFSHT